MPARRTTGHRVSKSAVLRLPKPSLPAGYLKLDWKKLEKAYGHKIPEKARDEIILTTTRMLQRSEAEYHARPLSESIEHIDRLKKAANNLLAAFKGAEIGKVGARRSPTGHLHPFPKRSFPRRCAACPRSRATCGSDLPRPTWRPPPMSARDTRNVQLPRPDAAPPWPLRARLRASLQPACAHSFLARRPRVSAASWSAACSSVLSTASLGYLTDAETYTHEPASN
jgi:hypothetical protein